MILNDQQETQQMTDRKQESYAVRVEAAELARSRAHPTHNANGDEQRFAGDLYFMSFTKGLPHDPNTGLLHDPHHFVEFRRAIDEGFIDPFTDRVTHGAKHAVNGGVVVVDNPAPEDMRQWEAPTAGTAHDLQGPDAQAVTMPPAPALLGADGKANPELIFEMAEVYELAILRDQPLNAFEDGASNPEIDAAIARLNALDYAKSPDGRPRKPVPMAGSSLALTPQTVFRGSSPGVEVGPYLSQFLLMGNPDRNGAGSVADGKIRYGVLQIDQRVPIAKPGADHMQGMDAYVSVQRGLGQGDVTYVDAAGADAIAPTLPGRRWMTTPRDLATYVHHDQLYQAYLNACLILLEMKTPSDPACDHLSGVGAAASDIATKPHAGGFALYGGPHILTLVTEVATRALKAVRFQKFNNHIRLRPEALAEKIELVRRFMADPSQLPAALVEHLDAYKTALEGNGGGGDSTLARIRQMNNAAGGDADSYFLPMAFPEGSPMHPAYGAGHATVAGACVTILKAYFDTSTVLARRPSDGSIAFRRAEADDVPVAFRAPALPDSDAPVDETKTTLIEDNTGSFLTLEGELNKLAANISIGRNMAGVHYFSDYYDSLRMGEQVALGVLEEQALVYPTDPFVLSVPTFDGAIHRIGRR
jgi:hypothetical protein